MPNKKSDLIWVVVSVESGVPTLVEAYHKNATAQLRADILKQDINQDYDEVGVFEVEVDVPTQA